MNVKQGVEFIIALGSIMGLLGLILGLLMFLMGRSRSKYFAIRLIIISIIIIVVCGLHTGTKYFRI